MDIIPRPIRGRVNALQLLISNIMYSLSNLMATIIYVVDPQMLFIIASITLLLSTPFIVLIPRIVKLEE